MQICRPLNLERIRKSLRDGNVTLKKMGALIPLYDPSCPYDIIVESRVQDWELGRRSVPEYVYCAYAAIVVDDWSRDRREASLSDHIDIDYRYGSMLDLGFAELLRLEHQVAQSSDPGLLAIVPRLASQRNCWQQHFKALFGLDICLVWIEKL